MNRTVAIFLVISVTSSLAQESSVSEILQRVQEAHGGAAFSKATFSIQVSGSYDVAGSLRSFEIIKHGHQIRQTITIGKEEYSTTWNGTDAWSAGSDGPAEKLDPKAAQLFGEEQSVFFSSLLDAPKNGNEVKLIGTKDLDGMPAIHLQTGLKSGRVQDWYVDPVTYRVIKKVVPGWSDWLGDHLIVYWFLEFKMFSGMLLPSFYEREHNETFIHSYKVDRVVINPKFDDQIFVLPKDLKKS